MPGIQGISQADIPKLRVLAGEGKSVSEIANGALLGYRAPEDTIQSFFDKWEKEAKDLRAGKKKAPRSQHPQDRSAARRKAEAEAGDAALAKAAVDEKD